MYSRINEREELTMGQFFFCLHMYALRNAVRCMRVRQYSRAREYIAAAENYADGLVTLCGYDGDRLQARVERIRSLLR